MPRHHKPLKALLTAAGSATGFGYGQSFARHFPYIRLLTADTNPATLTTTSIFSDKHFITENFDPTTHEHRLTHVFSEIPFDFYIPLIDAEITWASEQRVKKKFNSISHELDFCLAASKKSSYSKLTDGTALKSPALLSRSEFLTKGKAIQKKDGSFGSRHIHIKLSEQWPVLAGDDWFYYQFIEGREFTVDCFPIGKGTHHHTITSVRERLETKQGVCTKTRIGSDPVLTDFANILSERFSLSQPFCFQTKYDGTHHYLIDINPRLGGGTTMSALNGMDFFAAHIALILDQDPLPFLQRKNSECIVTRQYTDFLMSASGL